MRLPEKQIPDLLVWLITVTRNRSWDWTFYIFIYYLSGRNISSNFYVYIDLFRRNDIFLNTEDTKYLVHT